MRRSRFARPATPEEEAVSKSEVVKSSVMHLVDRLPERFASSLKQIEYTEALETLSRTIR